MLIFHNEKIKSDFEGTILDIETIEPFCWDYSHDDSRRYSKIIPTILGYITKNELKILCAKGKSALDELKKEVIELLPSMEKPLYAFQSIFERAVLYHCYNFTLKIDGELNADTYEGKGSACVKLGIPNYGDPFYNVGKKCVSAWLRGDYENAIKHNRSCLLKERDILIKRNYRKPDKLRMI
jgi:hypothetical protein